MLWIKEYLCRRTLMLSNPLSNCYILEIYQERNDSNDILCGNIRKLLKKFRLKFSFIIIKHFRLIVYVFIPINFIRIVLSGVSVYTQKNPHYLNLLLLSFGSPHAEYHLIKYTNAVNIRYSGMYNYISFSRIRASFDYLFLKRDFCG